MFDSIYIGMTGLTGFWRDLSVIGNNIANVNTVGFKGSRTDSPTCSRRRAAAAAPASTGSTSAPAWPPAARLLFEQGELRQSGNALDAASTATASSCCAGTAARSTRAPASSSSTAAACSYRRSKPGARRRPRRRLQLRDINISGLSTNAACDRQGHLHRRAQHRHGGDRDPRTPTSSSTTAWAAPRRCAAASSAPRASPPGIWLLKAREAPTRRCSAGNCASTATARRWRDSTASARLHAAGNAPTRSSWISAPPAPPPARFDRRRVEQPCGSPARTATWWAR